MSTPLGTEVALVGNQAKFRPFGLEELGRSLFSGYLVVPEKPPNFLGAQTTKQHGRRGSAVKFARGKQAHHV